MPFSTSWRLTEQLLLEGPGCFLFKIGSKVLGSCQLLTDWMTISDQPSQVPLRTHALNNTTKIWNCDIVLGMLA